jgi:hypothetical protein
MDVEIREADLADPAHAAAMLKLLDEYARLPIGQGAPLSPGVLRDLVPRLRNHPGTLILLLDGQAVGRRSALPDSRRSRPVL